ncbi:MAG: tyrosine-protein kinase family protein, partial [Flavobacteriaceae bacterium]
DCVCITVTSTVKGEGKTFAAANLAISLSNLNKKVLLLGADLRNPQLQRYDRNLRRLEGISEYLSGQNKSLEQLIITPTGSIPPNPAELWRSTNAHLMFADLRKRYDYIIIDSAPTLLVADTMILQDFSDLTLFSVRASYTHKEMLNFILDAHKDERIKNVGLFLNDVKLSNSYGYGYGYFYGYKYGYTYDKHNRSWFKRIMNS